MANVKWLLKMEHDSMDKQIMVDYKEFLRPSMVVLLRGILIFKLYLDQIAQRNTQMVIYMLEW